jgi:hypothetical protein
VLHEYYIEALKEALPPVFPGPSIGELTGGLFNWGSLQNFRSKGLIPEEVFGPRLGGSNAPTPVIRGPFIRWLGDRANHRAAKSQPPPRRRRQAEGEALIAGIAQPVVGDVLDDLDEKGPPPRRRRRQLRPPQAEAAPVR